MTAIQAIILGIIEGITEFLPISSTAHLSIAAELLKLQQSDFVKSFEIIIQLGAILAIVVLYFNILKKNIAIWKRILVAFLPTAVIGFALYKVIKVYILGNYSVIVWALLLGGVVLIIFEYLKKDSMQPEDSMHELETMPYKTAFLIGIAQALAVIPGVSRAAATIISGRMLGVGKQAIIEFSFLLAVPTMLAAAGYDFLKSSAGFTSSNMFMLSIGFITAFFAALISVKLLLSFIKSRSFTAFGIYRILLAIILLFYFL